MLKYDASVFDKGKQQLKVMEKRSLINVENDNKQHPPGYLINVKPNNF